jgi:hypothetical protein
MVLVVMRPGALLIGEGEGAINRDAVNVVPTPLYVIANREGRDGYGSMNRRTR